MIFSSLNFNCSNLLYLRNLQEQVKKAFCYQKLFWPSTVWRNCSSDLKNFEITRTICSKNKMSEQFLVTKCFFKLFLEVLRSNKLEQLKFKLEKNIGIYKHAGKVRKKLFQAQKSIIGQPMELKAFSVLLLCITAHFFLFYLKNIFWFVPHLNPAQLSSSSIKSQYIFKGSKLLVPVFCFADPV